MARWQGGLEHRQGFLARVVDIGAELFAMSAAVVRARMLRDDTDHGPEAVELADAFCRQARLRAERLFDELWHNTDGADTRLARHVLAGRYGWVEAGILDPAPDGAWIAAATPGPSTRENQARRILDTRT
jgi:hypothetical protein